MPQANIDSWLATEPAAGQAQNFLSWAATCGHCRAFTLPGRSGPAAPQPRAFKSRARFLSRCRFCGCCGEGRP